ncbi:MAG: FAD-dependent oxidoreductase, partial [Bacteroidota bacterium]
LCEGDKVIESDYTLIATAPHKLLTKASSKPITWKRCDTLYFEVAQRNIQQPIIGLVTDEQALINNIFYHTSLAMAIKGEKELLSVTVVKPHMLSVTDLIRKVEEELIHYCDIKGSRFIKHYAIEQALPQLNGLQNTLVPAATQQTKTIFLAGDYLLNASLNAAMITGECAALDIVAALKK